MDIDKEKSLVSFILETASPEGPSELELQPAVELDDAERGIVKQAVDEFLRPIFAHPKVRDLKKRRAYKLPKGTQTMLLSTLPDYDMFSGWDDGKLATAKVYAKGVCAERELLFQVSGNWKAVTESIHGVKDAAGIS